jgi:hypothetical protein
VISPDVAKSYEDVKKRIDMFVSASAYRYVNLTSFFALSFSTPSSSSSSRH